MVDDDKYAGKREDAKKKARAAGRDPTDLSKMSFAEHFDELRSRLFYCVISVVVFFIICYCAKSLIVTAILDPYEGYRQDKIAEGEPDPGSLEYISPAEGFLFYLKTSFLGALFLSIPVILYQLWRFIGAGLYDNERKSVMRVVPFSILLFLIGLSFGYFVLFPVGLGFLLDFAPREVLESSIVVSKYFDLFFMLIFIMGLIFQAPLIMVVTTGVGLTTPELFTSKRRYFVLGAFVAAALFTPPDPVTQCLLAAPLVILFEVGIFFSKRTARKKGWVPESEAESESELESSPPEVAG